MDFMTPVRETLFGTPTENNRYSPFSEDFACLANVLFHGTSEDRAKSIIQNGFSPTEELRSSSFTTSPGLALGYACENRHGEIRGAVLVVSFKTINVPGIRNEGDIVYLDDHSMQPTIVAVCYIPASYRHI